MSETAKEPKKISKRSSEEKIEIIVAIFLGITALATAWASWIGSLHGGNQATNYTKSNNLSSEGNSMWNEASQNLMQDMITWNDINEATLITNMRNLKTIKRKWKNISTKLISL